MAAVSVFVDNAVTGTLPAVCAKTGQPADGHLRIQAGSRQQWWPGSMWQWVFVVMVLSWAGWYGWWVLAFFWWLGVTMADRETLTVQLPWNERSQDSRLQLARQGRLAGAVTVLALAAAAVALLTASLLAAALPLLVGLVTACITAVYAHRLSQEQVVARLDASRRWVTLSRVHPDFVAATLAMAATVNAPSPAARRP